MSSENKGTFMRQDSQFLIEADKNHIIHSHVLLANQEKSEPIVIKEGSGVKVRDINGKEYIDGIGSLWLNNVGHGRKELAEVASQQIEEIEFHTTFYGYSTIPAVNLAYKLAQMAPAGMNKVHFTSGGSEANDTAMKMARLYHFLRGNERKQKIISRRTAYHGVTLGAVNVTGLAKFHRGFKADMDEHLFFDPPKCIQCPFNKEYPGCGIECAYALEELINREGAETIAAFIAEPIMGVGGVIVPPEEYFPIIREICDKNDILLLIDEVITGFGRTGQMFGVEVFNIKADIMTMAKGITSGYIPLGACLVHDDVFKVLQQDDITFTHGYTYSGHPVACAVANKNIQIIEDEGLADNAKEVGDYLVNKLKELQPHPNVFDVRGMGLLIGMEFQLGDNLPLDGEASNKLASELTKRGLINRMLMFSTLQITPALVLSKAEADAIVDIINDTIKAVF